MLELIRYEDVPQRAGSRVRERREERGWTREELATRADVSLSLLAQFERGDANPTLMTLTRPSEAAGLTLSELVAAEEDESTRIREAEPVTMWRGAGKSRAVLLVGASGRIDTELWRYDLAPGDSYAGAAHPPGSEVLIHVLEGTLEVSANQQSRVVGPGESVRVRSDVPHRYANAGTRLLTLVLVYTRNPAPAPMNR